jgi:hypothetical protein
MARISANVTQMLGRRRRCSRASKIEWEIEGIESSGLHPRVARVLSRGEADGGGRRWVMGRQAHDETKQGGRREVLGKGLKRRMVEEGGQRAVFIDVESGGGPVRAPCPIGGPLNPGGPTPRRRL